MTGYQKLLVEWINLPACPQNSTKIPGGEALTSLPCPPPIAGITPINVWDSRQARNIHDSCSVGSGGKDSPRPRLPPPRCPRSRAQPAAEWTWRSGVLSYLWAYLLEARSQPMTHASEIHGP